MNMRDAQILNARKKVYYCNLGTQVHHGCEHGESLLSSEIRVLNKAEAKRQKQAHASREEQHARYLDCGYQNWDDRE